jgi:DNA-binding transcriptional LysR family regulator
MAPTSSQGARADDDRGHPLGAQNPSASGLERVVAALGYRESGNPFPYIHEHRPVLRIGLCSSLSWGFLRTLIRQVGAGQGATALSFLEGSPQQIVRAASRDGIDVGFVYGPHDWAWARLQYEELWREPLMVLMPDAHPLASDSDVKPEALRNETFLVAGDMAEQELHTELLKQALGFAPAVRTISVEQATLQDLVGLGFGLTLTTGSALGAFHPGVAYRPLAAPVETISFHAVWRQSNRNEALLRFLDAARALAADWRG